MIYVTADLHGMAPEAFDGLLAKGGVGPADTVFILGDVLDRGEHGVALLESLLCRDNVIALMGNHERMFMSVAEGLMAEITEESVAAFDEERVQMVLDYLMNGGGPTLEAFRKLDRERRGDVLDYILDMPLYETVRAGGRDYLLCHGGIDHFDPAAPLAAYELDDFLWGRPELTEPFYGGEPRLVIGHTPTFCYGEEHRGRVIFTEGFIDVDTGRGHGGKAALLCLDTLRWCLEP